MLNGPSYAARKDLWTSHPDSYLGDLWRVLPIGPSNIHPASSINHPANKPISFGCYKNINIFVTYKM